LRFLPGAVFSPVLFFYDRLAKPKIG